MSSRRNSYGAALQKYGVNLFPQLQDFALLEVRGALLHQLLSEVEVLQNDIALAIIGALGLITQNSRRVGT